MSNSLSHAKIKTCKPIFNVNKYMQQKQLHVKTVTCIIQSTCESKLYMKKINILIPREKLL